MTARSVPALLAILIAACSPSAPPSGTGSGFVVKCDSEPLPEFTLGPTSNPTKDQQSALCACIWNHLGDWERRTAEQIVHGPLPSEFYQKAFVPRFGTALKDCGGMNL